MRPAPATDLPERYYVIGDALCGVNPIYGQGMTVAAIEAEVLRGQLGRGRVPAPREYFPAAARAVAPAWDPATGTDQQDPRVEGPRPVTGRLVSSYVDRLTAAAVQSPDLARTFLNVSALEPPQALMRPDRVARVLWATRRRASRPVPVGAA